MSGAVYMAGGWFEIGAADDADRRRHWAQFAAFSAGIGTPPGLFVTVGVARALVAGEQWSEARRLDPRLRSPDIIIPAGEDGADRPLQGVRAVEAQTLAHLLGGRLAHEKEIERAVSAYPGWCASGESWCAWTASSWSLFGYSLARWNPALQRWESPREGRFPASGAQARSVLSWDGERLIRLAREPGQSDGIRAAVVFDA